MSRIIGLLGSGVGMAAEYNEHRKEKKLSRENSQQDANATQAGPSSRPEGASRSTSSPSDMPPAYAELPPDSDRRLSSGGPATADKKAALGQYEDDDEEDSSDDSDDLPIVVDDEAAWALDEALERERSTDGPPSYDEIQGGYEGVDDLTREVLEKNRTALAAAPAFERTPLPIPVIIPQRRPRKKARGFVRAYAPLLGECSGISQDTFLTFLQNFYKSSQASPVFPIIMVAAGIAGLAPSVIAMAVTTAVQVGARVGQEVQTRSRTNNFLEKMNEELFKPAGLYAMIVKYKSDAEVAESGNSMLARFGVGGEKVDLSTNQAIAKYTRTVSEEKSMSDRMKNLRLASGSTKGAVNIPVAAPLIFPDVDKAVAKEGEQSFKDKSKEFQGFLADYMDRRSQVKYATADPNSALNVPEEQRAFRSKLADPNHPMYNGGIVGFVSGGYLSRDRVRGASGYDRGIGARGYDRSAGAYGYDRDVASHGYDRRSDKRMRRDDRRMQRYEDRLDDGRGLGRRKERRYENIVAERERYFGSRDYDDGHRYGGGRLGGGRRRRGGPLGLVGSLVGAAAGAVSGSGQQNASQSDARSLEYEDSYDNRLRPGYGDNRNMRRSFDEREAYYGGPAPHAPYGGQTSSSSSRPAPYGGQSYGSQSGDYGRPGYGATGYGGSRGSYGRRRRQGGGGPLGMVKKVMTEDVLYLMIVNLPSEEELAEAREMLAGASSGN